MSQTNEDIKQDFDHLCKEILLGTADKANIKIITKAMCDSNQQDYMRDEFKRIGEILNKR
jgi:uncharacterized membrane protein YkoI